MLYKSFAPSSCCLWLATCAALGRLKRGDATRSRGSCSSHSSLQHQLDTHEPTSIIQRRGSARKVSLLCINGVSELNERLSPPNAGPTRRPHPRSVCLSYSV